MAIKKAEIPDLIKYEGVDSKGFGKIAKLIMTDHTLDIGAKALYAYLCSYAGSENAAFPHRDKIFSDLKMCKTTYYKHLDKLTEMGYIRIERKKVYPFANTYIIVSRPPNLKQKSADTDNTDSLIVKGINSFGYGTIPKLVMLDNRISYKAKAIYAYFCSFAGNGTTAFPKRDDILRHLKISLNTYQIHMRDLIKYNYITVEHRHIKGRFASNNYILNDLPDEELGRQEIERRAEYQADLKRKKDDTETRIVDKDKVNIENSASPAIHIEDKPFITRALKAVPKTADEHADEIIEERELYENIIKQNISYDLLKECSDKALDEYLDLLVEIMVNAVVCKEKLIRINKREMPAEVVKSTLLKLNDMHIDFVCESMNKIKTMPQNLNAYLLTALYNSKEQIDPHFSLLYQHHQGLQET